MRNRKIVALALVIACSAAAAAQSDVIAKLGSSPEEASEAVFSAFSGGYVYMSGTRTVFTTANDQARAALVTGVINFARAYTTSADFAKRWGVFRENQKPSPPQTGPTSMAAMQAEQKKALEEAVKNMEEAAKKMPQMKATFDEQIKGLRAQIAELGKVDPAKNAQMDAILKQSAQQALDLHKQSVAEWEKKYPVDPKPVVVQRLREFLAMSATVDFTAKLVKKDGKMRFENPEYERKESQWKYMYRAGNDFHFMNTENYEMVEMSLDAIGDTANFLIEETELTVSYFEGRPVAIEPPTFVELTVTMTEPMMKGATQAASPKPATLETGHTLKVPQYIDIGDRVKVDTRDGSFIERVTS